MFYPLIILGGGLSGIAAAIRFARFGQKSIILEKHSKPGGLNSYYHRKGMLLETGLHAMTNFAAADQRHAPLNRLFRQLKLSRKKIIVHEQYTSEVVFPHHSLLFSNDISLFTSQIAEQFPESLDDFVKLVDLVREYDPFEVKPWISARRELSKIIKDPVLTDMILSPLMVYGNSEEHDMDFSQFVIMFQSIFLEGFFRPGATMKEFLDMLIAHYQSFGGEIRYGARVTSLKLDETGKKVQKVLLASGEEIQCDNVISTLGVPGSIDLSPGCVSGDRDDYTGKMSFVESIYFLPWEKVPPQAKNKTCIFFCNKDKYTYCRPSTPVEHDIGVINFPGHFHGREKEKYAQIRATHPANYELWLEAAGGKNGLGKRSQAYTDLKLESEERSLKILGEIIGNFSENIVYRDTFTPLTIERYSGKAQGAVYGSPVKVKDGRTKLDNFFLAGTDQGFLGIIGAMLSGVIAVNNHVLSQS